MTVCIATICTHYEGDNTGPMIVGAADRKLTLGDWTFEPFQGKRFHFLSSAIALVSGDMANLMAICTATERKLAAFPTTKVRELADLLATGYSEFRRRQAERTLLHPLGLALETYGSEPRERTITLDDELRRWQLQDSAIVAGIDDEGAHIWQVDDPGWPTIHDAIGFAAIGSGRNHALAEFMRVAYQRNFSSSRAMLLAYRAKKAAEVDPFVGKETDMFVIGPGAASFAMLNPELSTKVAVVYDRILRKNSADRKRADKEIEKYVAEFLSKSAQEAIDGRSKDQPTAAEESTKVIAPSEHKPS